MKKQFLDAVYGQDLMSVRLFLSNELLLDPRGKSFDEMLEYAEDHCTNLYEICNSDFKVMNDSNDWDQQYLNELKNEVDTHFIRSLLMHYKEVVLFVLKDKAEALNKQEQEARNNVKDSTEIYKKIACGTLLVGGVALTITGLYLTKSMMIKLGAASIIAGGFCVYKIINK